MNITSTPAPAPTKNWFTERRIYNGTIHQSYASETADMVSLGATITGVAAGASAVARAIAPASLLGGAAVTVAGVAAGFVAGGVGAPLAQDIGKKLFHAETDPEDGEGAMAGGLILGTVAGGAGALAGVLGCGPGKVALAALGTGALLAGGIAILDHHNS